MDLLVNGNRGQPSPARPSEESNSSIPSHGLMPHPQHHTTARGLAPHHGVGLVSIEVLRRYEGLLPLCCHHHAPTLLHPPPLVDDSPRDPNKGEAVEPMLSAVTPPPNSGTIRILKSKSEIGFSGPESFPLFGLSTIRILKSKSEVGFPGPESFPLFGLSTIRNLKSECSGTPNPQETTGFMWFPVQRGSL